MRSAIVRSCCILIMLCFWLNGQAQEVRLETRFSFDFKETDLAAALKTIENKANVRFSYVPSEIQTDKLGMHFTNIPLYQVLQIILANYNLSYVYVGQNSYVIKKESIDFEFSYQVSGFVRDKTTNIPLGRVIVSSPDEHISVVTNDSGFFHIRLFQSPQNLVFIYQGFHNSMRVAEQSRNYYHRILMDRNTLTEVVKRQHDTLQLNLRSSGFSMNLGTMNKTPSVHTSPGVLNSVKFITGFQSTLDVNGGITVRGGGLDENLVLYDGVLVYNPMHLPGWFSVFSKRSVAKAELIKSGFTSNYGGRTSSVVDIRSSPGNFKRYKFGLSASVIATEGYVEGPLVKDKISFVVSARRTFTDLWSPVVEDILSENGLKQINIYLYDINGNVDWKTGVNSKLEFRFYRGGDKGYLREKVRISDNLQIREDNDQSYHWGNMIGSAEWVKMINKNLNISFLSYYTRYGFLLDNSYEINIQGPNSGYNKRSDLKYGNEVSDLGSRVQVNWRLSTRHKVLVGADAISHGFNPPSTEYINTVNEEILDQYNAGNNRIQAEEVNAFFTYTFSSRKLLANGGLRLSFFNSDKAYLLWQPRLMLNWYPKPAIKIYAHYDRMNQFIFAVNSNEAGLQHSVWVPVSAGLDPIQADQFSMGTAKRLNGKTQIILEGYLKSYGTVYDYYNSNIDFLKNWQNQLSKGTGTAKGIELTLKSGGLNWNGWVAYTLSKADRKFANINDGQTFPFQFNRTHDLSVFGNFNMGNGWILGGSWIYASGNYITIPEDRYIIEFEGDLLIIENFGKKNNYKLPAYHRLDIGISKTLERNKFDHRISLSIYNAYFSQNPYYVTLSFNNEGSPVINQVNLLPILPILQYAIEFK